MEFFIPHFRHRTIKNINFLYIITIITNSLPPRKNKIVQRESFLNNPSTFAATERNPRRPNFEIERRNNRKTIDTAIFLDWQKTETKNKKKKKKGKKKEGKKKNPTKKNHFGHV